MSPIVLTHRFHLIQAFQAWLKTGAATHEEPKLYAKQVQYPGVVGLRPLYFIRRSDDGEPEMVHHWNRAINSVFPRIEDFDRAARLWKAARESRRLGR